MSVVAIGSSPAIDSLKLLGFKIYKVRGKIDKEAEAEILSKILESKAVVLEGEIYATLRSKIKELVEAAAEPPLLVVVPSTEKSETYRLEELYNLISLAVGVQLKWKK